MLELKMVKLKFCQRKKPNRRHSIKSNTIGSFKKTLIGIGVLLLYWQV